MLYVHYAGRLVNLQIHYLPFESFDHDIDVLRRRVVWSLPKLGLDHIYSNTNMKPKKKHKFLYNVNVSL